MDGKEKEQWIVLTVPFLLCQDIQRKWLAKEPWVRKDMLEFLGHLYFFLFYFILFIYLFIFNYHSKFIYLFFEGQV